MSRYKAAPPDSLGLRVQALKGLYRGYLGGYIGFRVQVSKALYRGYTGGLYRV